MSEAVVLYEAAERAVRVAFVEVAEHDARALQLLVAEDLLLHQAPGRGQPLVAGECLAPLLVGIEEQLAVALVRLEAGQAPKRAVEPLCSLAGFDGQIGARGVADEQRVPGQQDASDEEAAVFRPVAGRVQDADRSLPDVHELSVRERLERELRLAERVHVDDSAVLEGEPPVPGEMVCMSVRLEDARDLQAVPLRFLDIRLDLVRRVDDDGLPGRLGADQVGRAAEVVIDALVKDHYRRRYHRLPLAFLK